jgi:outer membrane protein assembly factor BamD
MIAPALRLLLVTLFLGMHLGCGAPETKDLDPEATARKTYVEAMEELIAGNYIQATILFNKVTRAPRYVRYAALARLRLGDALYRQQRFEEAIQAYRSFVAQYGSDPNIPYARYKVAVCFAHRIPFEWFASPPAYEMDLTMTQQALNEFKSFVSTFPTSQYAGKARTKIDELRNSLLAHELYVADYYTQREKWRAVAWRLHGAMDRYPDLAKTEPILFRTGEAYVRAGDGEDAERAFVEYLEAFPLGARRSEVADRLKTIRQKAPGAL